jgi:hypothetical protein
MTEIEGLVVEEWEHLPTHVRLTWFSGFPDDNEGGNGWAVLEWINSNGGDAVREGREVRIRRPGLGDFWLTPGSAVIWGYDREFYPSHEHHVRALYKRVGP